MREMILKKLERYKEAMGQSDEEPVVPINRYNGPRWINLRELDDHKLLEVYTLFARLYEIR